MSAGQALDAEQLPVSPLTPKLRGTGLSNLTITEENTRSLVEITKHLALCGIWFGQFMSEILLSKNIAIATR